jgi:hypothetical protein
MLKEHDEVSRRIFDECCTSVLCKTSVRLRIYLEQPTLQKKIPCVFDEISCIRILFYISFSIFIMITQCSISLFFDDVTSEIREGLLSLWLCKENNKLRDWKKCIYCTYSPLSSTHLWLRCSNFFNTSKKNSFGCAANRKIGNRKSQRLISIATYFRHRTQKQICIYTHTHTLSLPLYTAVSKYIKVKLPRPLIKHCEDIWRRGGIAPQFLASALNGSEWSASRPSHFTPVPIW